MCGKKVLDTKNYKQTSVWWCAGERTAWTESDVCEWYWWCTFVTFLVTFSVFYLYALTFTDKSFLFPTFCKTEYFPLIFYYSATATVAINREAQLSLHMPSSSPVCLFLYILDSILWKASLFVCFFKLISVCNLSYLSELKYSIQGHLAGFFVPLPETIKG